MNTLEEIIGNWIEIYDRNHNKTINDYSYATGVVSDSNDGHCEKCIAINKCWFKNEEDKRPPVDIVSNSLNRGLFHFGCHCNEKIIINLK